MEAVKGWARSLFMLAIFSSTALLIVPRSMLKQARFVAEMLLLLCVIAPLAGLLRSINGSASLPPLPATGSAWGFSLEQFHAEETARRVSEVATRAGLPVESVKVATKDAGFSLAEVTVCLSAKPEDEELAAFRDTLGAYLGIRKDRVKFVVPGAVSGNATGKAP